MKINVAIDGHSASGKSTIAEQLAQRTGLVYLDTGLMYRALAYEVIENAAAADDLEGFLSDFLPRWELKVELPGPNSPDCKMLSSGKDITRFLHRPEVARMVSKVAAVSAVRTHLVHLQQELAKQGGMILVGRDIASVVLPQAELKVFVTASLEARAQRRHKDFMVKGSSISLEKVREDLAERDRIDTTREDSPLICVADAREVDTTNRTPEQVLDLLVGWVQELQHS